MEEQEKPDEIDEFEEGYEDIVDFKEFEELDGIDITKPKEETRPPYDLNDVDSVAKEAAQIPEDLKANHRKIFALTRRLEGTQKRMKEIYSKNYQEVNDEKIGGSKRFPDRKSIDRETTKRLEESSIWGNKKAEIYIEVSDLETDDGKRKYMNEKTRGSETNKRLYNNEEIKNLRESIMKSVIKEMEPGRQKFTNDKSRDYETNRRIMELAEYKLLQEEEKKAIEQQQEVRENINYLNKRWDYMKMVISLMEIKYRLL